MKILKKGFTLIELLIVIAIIGILATLILTNLTGVRQRARDARRKGDLKSIQQSLRLYYNDASSFPTSSASFEINGCGTIAAPATCGWGDTFAISQGGSTITYMGALPEDPGTSPGSTLTYEYFSNGNFYALVANLENLSDSDISASQAQCPASYAAYLAASGSDSTLDYVVCEE